MTPNVCSVIGDEHGQALPEYAMILGMIAVASYTAVHTLGHNISVVLTKLGDDLASAGGGGGDGGGDGGGGDGGGGDGGGHGHGHGGH